MKKTLLYVALLVSGLSNGQNLIAEGFDTFTNLATAGWLSTNQSEPIGTGAWAQGGGTAFSGGGQAGGATSFTLCNYTSATGVGTISNWLITPVLSLQNGDVITFYTRTGGDPPTAQYPDRLELRVNSTDTSVTGNPTGATGVGAFTTLALTVNPDLTGTGYPFPWTQYTYTVSGLTGVVSCKIGFRYYVTNGGTLGDNSNIIALDTFSVDRPLSTDDFFASNFSLSPNPISTNFTIQSNNQLINSVQVTDINGRIVKNNSFETVSNVSVDISDLKPGMYFVTVQSDNGSGTSKVFKI